MTSKQNVNRIPGEDVHDCQVWSMPEIDFAGEAIPSAEREDRENHDQAQENVPSDSEETHVEDLPENTEVPPLTAEKLEEITRDAEEEGRKQGYGDGFDRGLKEGRQKAYSEADTQIKQQQTQLQSIVETLMSPVQEQDQALEQVLVQMVCQLTKQVVKRELAIDSSCISEIVQQAVNALPLGAKNITVYVSPKDHGVIQEYLQQQEEHWQLSQDSELTPGGCRVETHESLVNFSVEKRLSRFLEQFVSQLVDNPAAEQTDQPQESDDVAMPNELTSDD